MPNIDCEHGPEFDHPSRGCGAPVVVRFNDHSVLEEIIDQPRGFDPPISNNEIYAKWRSLTDNIMDRE